MRNCLLTWIEMSAFFLLLFFSFRFLSLSLSLSLFIYLFIYLFLTSFIFFFLSSFSGISSQCIQITCMVCLIIHQNVIFASRGQFTNICFVFISNIRHIANTHCTAHFTYQVHSEPKPPLKLPRSYSLIIHDAFFLSLLYCRGSHLDTYSTIQN